MLARGTENMSSRANRVLALLVLACVPCLFAFTSCLGTNVAVNPSSRCNLDIGCSRTEQGNAALDVIAKLNQQPPTGVVGLQFNWDLLEQCVDNTGGGATIPPGTIPAGGHNECFFPEFDDNGAPGVAGDAPKPCLCWYDFSGLKAFLDAFVPTTAFEADALLQIGPIFTGNRRVPPYLGTTPIRDPTFVTAYKAMYDQLAQFLAGISEYEGASFVFSIGNEVNVYFVAPITPVIQDIQGTRVALPVAIDGAAVSAFQDFNTFFAEVKQHISANPPLTIVGGKAGPLWPRVTGVTIQWDQACGPATDSDCPDPLNEGQRLNFAWETLSLIAASDVQIYTYYPTFPVSGNPDDFRTEIGTSILRMYEGAYLFRRPVILQEYAFPSSFDATGTVAQNQFLENAFDAIATTLLLDQLIAGETESDFFIPGIQGANYFQLHDFGEDFREGRIPCSDVDDCPQAFDCDTVLGVCALEDATCNLPSDCPITRPGGTQPEFECSTNGTCLVPTSCTSDADCPVLHTCDDVGAASKRCIIPAPCDFALLLGPTGTCSEAEEQDTCLNGFICSTAHACTTQAGRVALCTTGLHTAVQGLEKPSWQLYKDRVLP